MAAILSWPQCVKKHDYRYTFMFILFLCTGMPYIIYGSGNLTIKFHVYQNGNVFRRWLCECIHVYTYMYMYFFASLIWNAPKVFHIPLSHLGQVDPEQHWFGWWPLPEPMLPYCQLNPWEQFSIKFESKCQNFVSRKCVLKKIIAMLKSMLVHKHFQTWPLVEAMLENPL